MSAASLLKVYDGQDPELAFGTAPGSVPNLAAVLGSGAAAGNIAMTALGDLTFGTGDTITGPASARLDITSGVGQGVKVEGLVGASLKATTGGATLESTAGAITLTAGAAAPGGLVLSGAGLPATAATSAAAFYTGSSAASHYLAITIGATPYYIPMSAATW